MRFVDQVDSDAMNKQYLFYVTLFQIVSGFGVVVLHVNGTFWMFRQNDNWLLANAAECLFYFAVPIFLWYPVLLSWIIATGAQRENNLGSGSLKL